MDELRQEEDTSAAHVEAWAASLLSQVAEAPSLQAKVVDSKFLWLVCASVAQALEIVNRCASNDGGVSLVRVYRATQWLRTAPEEVMTNSGFGAPASARPVTSARVATRLINRHISSGNRREDACPW